MTEQSRQVEKRGRGRPRKVIADTKTAEPSKTAEPTKLQQVPGQEIDNVLRSFYKKLEDVLLERDHLTARKKSAFTTLESKYGLNPHALEAARRYSLMTDEQRTNWDLSFYLARKARDCPVQGDLFEGFSMAIEAAGHTRQ